MEPQPLPDLDSVRSDCELVKSVCQTANSLPEEMIVRIGPVPRTFIFYSQLPELFMYSFLIHVDDVPADI